MRFDEKVKRFAINILHSERRDDERRPRVTGLVPVVGYDLVVPEVRGINRRWSRRTLDWYSVSDCVACGNRRRRLASKLPNAEARTCEARVRVYPPPLSVLHGYVDDRMWRHGVSGELLGSSLRGRSQLSTFMKAYTVYARGRGSGTTVRFSPENKHLFLITDNVL